jgi:hypothetical protein
VPRKTRSGNARFSIGEKVEVTKAIRCSRFQGATGVVTKVTESRHAVTLDTYLLHFEAGDDQEFWDVELTAFPAVKDAAA